MNGHEWLFNFPVTIQNMCDTVGKVAHSGIIALSPTLFNYIIDWILRQALQDYTGVQVGANVHVSDLAYADDIVILNSSYSEMKGSM